MFARLARRALFVFCVFCHGLVPLPALASDQDLARARVLDQQGVRAYREERYNDAIRYFDEARKLGGPPSEIWNIAKCHERLDEPEEATKYLQEYLDLKGLGATDRAEAEEQLHEIQHRHSTVTISSSPSGATVYLEGHRWAGVTPATVDVAPGDHRLTLEEPGYETVERPITAKYGRAVIVDARLSKSSRAAGTIEPATQGGATSEASAHTRGGPHHLALAAEIGVTVPRFGSIGGSAAAAGYFSAAYIALDDADRFLTLGAEAMLTGDSWSNTSGLPNTNQNCTYPVPNGDGATAFSAFLEGGAAWRVAPHLRLGGELGLGVATYALGEAGRDVFLPSCRPSPGVEPVVHLEALATYSFSRELRLLVSPFIFEVQPAFGGASPAPRDATGPWLRFSAAAGLAFDLL
jgi:PEGA domain